ncbi:MAG: hypothetical protein ACI4OJ_13775 [Lachnospiraceae bacterium]
MKMKPRRRNQALWIVTAAALWGIALAAFPAAVLAKEPMWLTRESAAVQEKTLAADRESLSFSVTYGCEAAEKKVILTNESGKDLTVYLRSEGAFFTAGGADFVPSATDGILEAVIPGGESTGLVLSPREDLAPGKAAYSEKILITGSDGSRAEILAGVTVSYDSKAPEILANGDPLTEETYKGDVVLTAKDCLLSDDPDGPYQETWKVPEVESRVTLYARRENGAITAPVSVIIPRSNEVEEETPKANSWTVPLSIESWTIAEVPCEPIAEAAEGDVTFRYYDSGKNPLDDKPTKPGLYFVRAMAGEGTDDELVSGFVAFSIEDAHAFGDPAFVWGSGHRSASAVFTCLYEEEHRQILPAKVTITQKAPSCEEVGACIYTAQVSFAGNVYEDTWEVEIPALGHAYEKAVFTWSEENSACRVEFVCTHDADHTVTSDCRVTKIITKEKTCTEAGEAVLTATALRPDGTVCSECRIVEIPAGHNPVQEGEQVICSDCGIVLEKSADGADHEENP